MFLEKGYNVYTMPGGHTKSSYQLKRALGDVSHVYQLHELLKQKPNAAELAASSSKSWWSWSQAPKKTLVRRTSELVALYSSVPDFLHAWEEAHLTLLQLHILL